MRQRTRPLAAGFRKLAFLAIALTAPLAAAEDLPRHVLSPLLVLPVKPPIPVPLADGRTHLAYELLLVNQSDRFVAVDSVDVLARDGGAVAQTLRGPELEAMLRLAGNKKGSTFEPGAAGFLFLDVSFARDAALPHSLEHRFALSLREAKPGADATPLVVVAAPTEVSAEKPSVIAPPLEGGRWLVANGCCTPIESHRGAMLSIDGTLYASERFAIDFVRLDDEGRLFTGDKTKLESYPFFGVPVLSVADGVVVDTHDGLPEQIPGALPSGIDYDNVGGNFVVVEIAKGRYAFYAHLQPGSVAVKKGDRVRRGQVLGLLGNTGNTDAPHLHFHMMDGPAPLLSNGIPYVFTTFVGNGAVTDIDPVFEGKPAPIDAAALAGPHRDVLPRDLELVTFPAPTRP